MPSQSFGVIGDFEFHLNVAEKSTSFGGTIATHAGRIGIRLVAQIDDPSDVIDYSATYGVVTLSGRPLGAVLDTMAKHRERLVDLLQNPSDLVRHLVLNHVCVYSGEGLEVRPAAELALDNIHPPVLDFVEADFDEARRILGDEIVIFSVYKPWNSDLMSGYRFRMLALRDHAVKLADGTLLHRIDGVGYNNIAPVWEFKLARFYAIQSLHDDAWVVAPTEIGVKRKFAKYVPSQRPILPEPPRTDADDAEDDALRSLVL